MPYCTIFSPHGIIQKKIFFFNFIDSYDLEKEILIASDTTGSGLQYHHQDSLSPVFPEKTQVAPARKDWV